MSAIIYHKQNVPADSLQIGSVDVTVTGTQINTGVAVANSSSVTTLSGVKVYRALLTQTGSNIGGINPPIATVLENSLGETPIWSCEEVEEGVYANGSYLGTGLFPLGKTFFLHGDAVDSANDGFFVTMKMNESNKIYLRTTSNEGGESDQLRYCPVMILVYP